MSCAIEGCDARSAARGWCEKHYRRWKRHGDTSIVGKSQAPPPIWRDPLTADDYMALRAAVEADAQKLLPIAVGFIVGRVSR